MEHKIIPVQIVKIGPEEIKRLKEISISTFLETFAASNTTENMNLYLEETRTGDKLLQELDNPGSAFYFAFIEEKLAGYLKINTGAAQTEPLQDSLEIERIYVLALYQGKRIGQELMKKAFDIAKAKKIKTVWLGVWEHNHKAIRFYRQYGFEAFGQHIFRLGNDEQTDILMKVAVN